MYRLTSAVCVLVVALTSATAFAAKERPAVAAWNFDGDLLDRSGRGNDIFTDSPSFKDGHRGQGLECGKTDIVVPDRAELRPAPGLRIECWARFDSIGTSWQPLLIKDDGYQLRLDPPKEGGHFSFFLNLDGWEPRIRSAAVAKVGVWYHLQAGWDGKEIWIDVDGERASRPRTGVSTSSQEPLELGQFDGVLDEVRIENPNAKFTGVAQWRFDGNLQDSSAHGYHLSGDPVSFVPVPGGEALKLGTKKVHADNHPDLQLAPGLCIDCSIYVDKEQPGIRYIAYKHSEYQLRINPPDEGGAFAFFINLNGWEPRVSSDERVLPGHWYRVTAKWDGFALTLDVNGKQSKTTRTGLPKPSDSPLVIGGFDGRIDNLTVENPRLPALRVRDVRQEHAILCAGRTEKLTAAVRNIGMAAKSVTVDLDLPSGARCLGSSVRELGPMPMGGEKTVEWQVRADAASFGTATIRVNAADGPQISAGHALVFFAGEDSVPTSLDKQSSTPSADSGHAVTYYIDDNGGSNANAGTSPETAWKDFTQVNDRILGPGERLLLKRGSVFNQELIVTAKGTTERWAEIGTYGVGPRPIIHRNWDIEDRCVLVKNPDYLRISGLTVCYAAKGLVVAYTETGHRGLVVEDCIAHHIEGLYRKNAHGIPEWTDRNGPTGDGGHSSAGISIGGAPARDQVFRDCESFQCSSGWSVRNGYDVVIDRVYSHHNFAYNTSPHPFLVGTRHAVLQNTIFNASGYHASAGTMGIMLAGMQGLIIRNCYFSNQPDSGSHDEGGIDFENSGNACLIDHCTFENNAGAAIEVLGLRTPQTTNIEIRNSRFIKNNTADKLGPAEVFVWGRTPNPAVCCSTGLIRDNGYVTLPNVEFYVNEAPKLTSWTLANNQGYATTEALEQAMPFNRPPVVDAGEDIHTDSRTVKLAGTVTDDNRPQGAAASLTWEVIEQAGSVAFDDRHAARTTATFSAPGDYLLRLKADDGELWQSDMVTVHILPTGTSIAAAWEFNQPLDKEGWTEADLGTQVRKWPNPVFPTTSHPVKYAAGGYYIVAIEQSSRARLLSADNLGLPLTGREKLNMQFQNHTPATEMRLRFLTDADATWDDAKSMLLPVVANDNFPRTYEFDLSAVKTWKGRLKQLRLDFSTGEPVTGTCRFDYIWLTKK